MRNGIAISAVIHLSALLASYADLPDWLRSKPQIVEKPVFFEMVAIDEKTVAEKQKLFQKKPKSPPPISKVRPLLKRELIQKRSKPEIQNAEVLPEPKAQKSLRRPTAMPKPKPKPPQRFKEVKKKITKKYKFDASKIAALVDKTPRTIKPVSDIKTLNKKIVAKTAAPLEGRRVTISELDALRMQIERCWIVQAGARYAEDLAVKVRVYLKSDGSLQRDPKIVDDTRMGEDPFFRAAAESAIRAILKCAPFKMPAEKYNLWREMELTFDPTEMLG